MHKNHVVVIGAGVCGLTAAHELAGLGMGVSLIEKTPFLGGHAIQLNCKATDECVKCGACLAEEKLLQATRHPNIEIHTGAQIESVSAQNPYQITCRIHSPLVNADRCNGCGICFQKCPVPGTILQGRAPRVGPYVAIRRDLCRYFNNAACTLCRDICPQEAISLDAGSQSSSLQADAIIAATGFAPYNPSDKPYGYGRFQNVVTNLDAERMLREDVVMKCPSDGREARRIAFIQCVGSRDTVLNHPWCSKICCGSSLRMARLIQSRSEKCHITFFYIDIQTFGKDFQQFYNQAKNNIDMVRAIPGDIYSTEKDELKVIYFDPESKASNEALFDVVILSAGLLPSHDNEQMSQLLGCSLDTDGFMLSGNQAGNHVPDGIFIAGAALGPMSIAESISSAEKAVFDATKHLGMNKNE